MNAIEVRAMTDEFLGRIRRVPHGEKIDQCLQCGTCSASCPSSHAMDYPPRAILAALRAGMLDRVLGSNTVWLCASCYSCAVRCPAGIPFTDAMYQLKRMGIERGVFQDKGNSVAMAKAFVANVDKHGRSAESELMRNYFLRTKPLAAISFLPLGWRLLRRGRLNLRPRSIRGLKALREMMTTMERNVSAGKEGSK
jgi:heterodisulfide reductase subunit C